MGTAAAFASSRLDTILSQPLSQIVHNPATLELLRFDLSVAAQPSQPSGWQHIQFTLSSAPGLIELFTPETKKQFKVLIMDEFGNKVVKGYQLSSRGETVVDTVEVPLPDPSKLHGSVDRGRTIYVVADPCQTIWERTDANNVAMAYCYTIG